MKNKMKIDTTYHWHVLVEKFDGAKNYHELLIVESDKGYFIEDEPHRDMREYDSIPIEYIGSTKYVAKSSDFFKTLKDCVNYPALKDEASKEVDFAHFNY